MANTQPSQYCSPHHENNIHNITSSIKHGHQRLSNIFPTFAPFSIILHISPSFSFYSLCPSLLPHRTLSSSSSGISGELLMTCLPVLRSTCLRMLASLFSVYFFPKAYINAHKKHTFEDTDTYKPTQTQTIHTHPFAARDIRTCTQLSSPTETSRTHPHTHTHRHAFHTQTLCKYQYTHFTQKHVHMLAHVHLSILLPTYTHRPYCRHKHFHQRFPNWV